MKETTETRNWMLTVTLLVVWSGVCAAQESFRPAADFRMASIPGAAELSCDFQDPQTKPDDVVQGRELPLVMTIVSTRGDTPYSLSDVVQSMPQPHEDRALHQVQLVGRPTLFRTRDDVGRTTRDYVATLKIAADASPRQYVMQLTISAPNKRDEIRNVSLYVGARDQANYVNASAAMANPRLSDGVSSDLSLVVENKYPTYRITLDRIEVESVPGGVIEKVKQPLQQDIPPGASRRITIPFTGRSSVLRLLSPVQPMPKLRVLLVYNDGFRSGIERLPYIEFDVLLDASPSMVLLLGLASLVVGGAAGAYLRIRFVTPPPRERKIQVWERVLASILLSAVFVLIAVLARLEVVAEAFKFKVPLHIPVATAGIAFLVSLYDPTELVGYLKRKTGLSAKDK